MLMHFFLRLVSLGMIITQPWYVSLLPSSAYHDIIPYHADLYLSSIFTKGEWRSNGSGLFAQVTLSP